MDKKIKEILRDIYSIAPDLRDREDELKKTIEQLLVSKPKREMDPGFKKELLDKLLAEFGKQEPRRQAKRVFFLRPAFITVAASLLVCAMGVIVFLPKNARKAPISQPQFETIIVSGKSPTIDRRSTHSSMNLTKEVLEKLPNSQEQNIDQKNANTEGYDHIKENTFFDALKVPLSTFSIDVDTASYSNVRRFLTGLNLPPVDAVKIEEMINYFPYDYPLPRKNKAFSITTEISACPWAPKHHLVLIGLKGKDIEPENLPPSNLVFLVDVSGSMGDTRKLPLLIESFKLLTHELQARDRAGGALGDDKYGYRKEFIKLVKIAGDIKKETPADEE